MKKAFLFVLFVVALFSFTGCSSKKLEGVKSIKKDDIFNQEEDKYYIYFHRINCEDCENSSVEVINYMAVIKEYSGCSTKRPIFDVLLYTKDEKPGDLVHIFREYDGIDGEGNNGNFKVKDVTKWEDLYIGSVSCLISISLKNGVKVARLEAEGAEAIKIVLQEQLGECYR